MSNNTKTTAAANATAVNAPSNGGTGNTELKDRSNEPSIAPDKQGIVPRSRSPRPVVTETEMVEAASPGIELSQPANASDANSVIGYNGDQQSAAPNTAATTTSSNGEPIVDIFIPRRGGGSGREPGFQKYTNRINDRAQTYSVLKTIPRRAMIKEYIIKPFLNEGRKIFRWCKKSDQWVCIKDNKDEELIDKLTEAIVQKMSDYLTNCRKRKKREQAKRAREGSNYTPTVCILVAQKPNLRLDGKPMRYDIKFLGKILRRLQKFREQRIEQDKLSKQRITSANSETTAHLNSLKRKQGSNGEYNDSNKRSKTSQAPTKSRDENQTVNASESTTIGTSEQFSSGGSRSQPIYEQVDTNLHHSSDRSKGGGGGFSSVLSLSNSSDHTSSIELLDHSSLEPLSEDLILLSSIILRWE